MRDDNQHLFFCLCTLVSGLIWIVGSSFFNAGWVTATIIAFGVFFLIVFYLANSRDPGLLGLLALALIAGFMGLAADWWLIHVSKTLVYYPGGPRLGRTPLYVPFGLTSAFFVLGCLSCYLSTVLKRLPAAVLAGLLGAGSLFVYEHCAEGAGWWYHQNTGMLGNTPYHVLIGGFLTAAALPSFARWAEAASLLKAVGLGLVLGLWFVATFALPASLF